MSLFQHSTYGQNIEATVATSNPQTCSAGWLWQNRWTHLEWVPSNAHTIYENRKTSITEPQIKKKKGSHLGEILENLPSKIS